ncbi:polyprotein [Ceratobasidium endornavirus C]|uniref:polyprotein n=1 Tax=Ceratobasidium endornavirus C TaxID=1908813 RepID=UPI000870DF1C|nr:polyprotein [Ceratobasidium endornavirus C]AOV81703.1 polyprotein [Ceratobasidium endornavirus C]
MNAYAQRQTETKIKGRTSQPVAFTKTQMRKRGIQKTKNCLRKTSNKCMGPPANGQSDWSKNHNKYTLVGCNTLMLVEPQTVEPQSNLFEMHALAVRRLLKKKTNTTRNKPTKCTNCGPLVWFEHSDEQCPKKQQPPKPGMKGQWVDGIWTSNKRLKRMRRWNNKQRKRMSVLNWRKHWNAMMVKQLNAGPTLASVLRLNCSGENYNAKYRKYFGKAAKYTDKETSLMDILENTRRLHAESIAMLESNEPMKLGGTGDCWKVLPIPIDFESILPPVTVNYDKKVYKKFMALVSMRMYTDVAEAAFNMNLPQKWIDAWSSPLEISVILDAISEAADQAVINEEEGKDVEVCYNGEMMPFLDLYEAPGEFRLSMAIEGEQLNMHIESMDGEGEFSLKEIEEALITIEDTQQLDLPNKTRLKAILGVVPGIFHTTSIQSLLNTGEVLETSKWKALVENRDLRAAALALAKVDHHVYSIPGCGDRETAEKMNNPDKGGWALGMNVQYTNELSPNSWVQAFPEAAAVHISRQMFSDRPVKIYAKPQWLNPTDHLNAKDKAKYSLAFFTETSLNEANLQTALNGCRQMVAVLPTYNEDMPHLSSNEDGNYLMRRVATDLEVVREDSTQVTTHNADIISALNKKDLLVIGGKLYKVTIIGTVCHDTVVSLTLLEGTPKEFSNIFALDHNSTVKRYTYTMPKFDATLGFMMPTFETRTVDIDDELLRVVFTHNLHRGDLDFRTLLTRCIGFAHRRYHMKHSVKQRSDLSPQQLIDHALLAALLVRRAYVTRRWLADLSNSPRWAQVAIKGGFGLANLVLQALHEHSGTYQKFESWMEQVTRVSGSAIKDFTNQAVFGEIEAWMFRAKTKAWECYSVGSKSLTVSCLHHDDCTHTGPMSCLCCGQPSNRQWCTCCSRQLCRLSHSCQHSCSGNHTGSEVCTCCNMPSDEPGTCKNCKPATDMEYDLDYEWDEFVEKLKAEGGKPASNSAQPVLPEGMIMPSGPCSQLSNGQYLHKCALCDRHYSYIHPLCAKNPNHFQSAKACPHCSGGKAQKTDEYGIPLKDEPKEIPGGWRPAAEEEDKEPSPRSRNVVVLLKMGHTLSECLAIAGSGESYNNLYNWQGDTSIELPMIPYGTQSCRVIATDFEDKLQIQRGVTCGLAVLQTLTNKANEADATILLKKSDTYSSGDMVALAEAWKLNLILLAEKEIVITKNKDSEVFDCILANEPGHWTIGTATIDFKDTPLLTKAGSCSTQDVTKMRNKAMAKGGDPAEMCFSAEIVLCSERRTIEKMFKAKIEDGHITNNARKAHRPKAGLFHFKLPDVLPKHFQACFSTEPYNAYQKALEMEWKHSALTNITSEIANRLLEAAMTVASAHCLGQEIKSAHREHAVKVESDSASQTSSFLLPADGKWMDGDLIRLTNSSIDEFFNVRVVTDMDRRSKAIIPKPNVTGLFKCRYTKGGYVSALQTIAGLLPLYARSVSEGQNSSAIPHKCVIGVPGSGKSTRILSLATRNDLIITATNGNKRNMRDKMKAKDQKTDIMGPLELLQAATAKNHKNYEKIYIDECTMVTYLEYLAATSLLNNHSQTPFAERIELYGDDSQIGATCITARAQVGTPTGLHRFATEDNTEHWLESYRLKTNAAEVASKVTGKAIVSKVGGNLKITTMNVNDPIAAYQSAVKQFNGKDFVTLCFNRDTQIAIQKRDSSVKVDRIHGFQGQEAKKVLVLQEKPTAKGSVSTDPRYTYSAFTRAQDHIIWVSMGFNSEESIESRIGMRHKVESHVGQAFKDKVKHFMSILRRKPEVKIRDDVLDHYFNHVVAPKWELKHISEEVAQSIRAHASQKFGASVTFDVHGNSDVMAFSRGVVTAVVLHWDGKDLVVKQDTFKAINNTRLQQIHEALKGAEAPRTQVQWETVMQITRKQRRCMDIVMECVKQTENIGLLTSIKSETGILTVESANTIDCAALKLVGSNGVHYLSNPDENDTIVSSSTEENTAELLSAMERWVYELCGSHDVKAVHRVLAVTGAISKIKSMAASAINATNLMTVDLDAKLKQETAAAFESENRANLYAYQKMDTIEGSQFSKMHPARLRKTEQYGWITRGRWIPISEWKTASAIASITYVDELMSGWMPKLVEIITAAETLVAGAVGVSIKGWSQHMEDDSATGQYLANKVAQLRAKMLKNEPKPITWTPGARLAWNDLIAISMPACGMHYTSAPNLVDPNWAAAEQVALRMVPSHKRITHVTVNPNATLLSGRYSDATARPLGNASGHLYDMSLEPMETLLNRLTKANVEKVNIPEAKANLENVIENAKRQLAGEGDIWCGQYDTKVQHSTTLVSASALSQSGMAEQGAELLHYLNSSKELLVITPNLDPHSRRTVTEVMDTDLEMSMMTNTMYGVTFNACRALRTGFATGRTQMNGVDLSVDCFAKNSAISIWKIQKEKRVTKYSPLPEYAKTGMQTVELPDITPDLMTSVLTKKAVTKRKLTIDNRIYRSLNLRALREGTSFEDLLMAARTMLHGVIYSPGGTAWKHQSDSSILMDTALVVFVRCRKLLNNAIGAARMLADTLTENPLRNTMGYAKDLARGLAAQAQTVLGLNYTDEMWEKALASSDNKVLHTMADMLHTWNFKVNDYHREILHGEAVEMEMPFDQPVPAITRFALANLLHWRSLGGEADHQPRVRRYTPPAGRKQQLPVKQQLRDALTKQSAWWMVEPEISDQCDRLQLEYDSNPSVNIGIWGNKAKMNKVIDALANRNLKMCKLLLTDDKTNLVDKAGTQKVMAKLASLNTTLNSRKVPAHFNQTATKAVAVAKANPGWPGFTSKFCNSILEELEDLDNANWQELASLLEAGFAVGGLKFTKVRTASINLNTSNIVIFAIGSRGDIRPAHNLAKQLSLDGASVSFVCPSNSCEQTGSINYVTGQYDVNKELDKWHKITNFGPETLSTIFKDELDNNWIRGLDYDSLPTTIDLVIGSPVSPQGLMYASSQNIDYVDFCPMPLSNEATNTLQRVYQRLLSREYVLLHLKAITLDFKKLSNMHFDVDKLLTYPRPYLQATEAKLAPAEKGEVPVCNFGSWGSKSIGETWDSIADEMPLGVTKIVTMGSMRDPKTAEFMLDHLDGAETVVLAQQGSPLYEGALRKGITVLTGNYNLAEIPTSTTVWHHGGAGTTQELAAAGVWQVITPVSFDQKYWANRITEAGVGGMFTQDVGDVSLLDVRPCEPVLPSGMDVRAQGLCSMLTKCYGIGVTWVPKGNVFDMKAANVLWWNQLIGDDFASEQGGVFLHAIEDKPRVTFDPLIEQRELGERMTCGARAFNYYYDLAEGDLRLRLKNIGLAWADLDNNGMTKDQFTQLALCMGENVQIYSDGLQTTIISQPTKAIRAYWWQSRGHVVAVETNSTLGDQQRHNVTMASTPRLNTTKCTQEPLAVSWPTEINGQMHPDMHARQADFEEAIRSALSGEPMNTNNPALRSWCGHLNRITTDRVKSNFAISRRADHSWIGRCTISTGPGNAKLLTRLRIGELVALQMVDGTATLGIVVFIDEDGWSHLVTTINPKNATGLYITCSTLFISRGKHTGTVTGTKAWNNQTNAVLGTDLPIVDNNEERDLRATKVLVGHYDGIPHHWSKSPAAIYHAEDLLFGEGMLPDAEMVQHLTKYAGILRGAVFGDQKLWTVPIIDKDNLARHYIDQYEATTRFGFSFENEPDLEMLRSLSNGLVVDSGMHNLEDHVGYFKLTLTTKDFASKTATQLTEMFGPSDAANPFLEGVNYLATPAPHGVYYYKGLNWSVAADTVRKPINLDDLVNGAENYYLVYTGNDADEVRRASDSATAIYGKGNGLPQILPSVANVKVAANKRDDLVVLYSDDLDVLLAADKDRSFCPADAVHGKDVHLGPPVKGSPSGWGFDGSGPNKLGLSTDWRVSTKDHRCFQVTLEQGSMYDFDQLAQAHGWEDNAAQNELLAKYKTASYVLMDLEFNGEEFTMTSFGFRSWRGSFRPAEFVVTSSNNSKEGGLFDPSYPIGSIKYRENERNEFRNGNSTKMHHLNLPDDWSTKPATSAANDLLNSLANALCKIIEHNGNKRVIITANADWSPEKRSMNATYINLTYDSRPQQGWVNVLAPDVNGYTTSLRQLRTILWYSPLPDRDWLVTVVGGRDDFNEVAKGSRADLPETRGVFKHIKTVGGAQLYLNNCTGHAAAGAHLWDRWVSDMQHTSHIYGTDEWFMAQYTCNHMRTVMTLDQFNYEPMASYPRVHPIDMLPHWFKKEDKERVMQMQSNLSLTNSEDDKAIATRICKISKPHHPSATPFSRFQVPAMQYATSIDGSVVIGGATYQIHENGLLGSVSNAWTTILNPKTTEQINITQGLPEGCLVITPDVTTKPTWDGPIVSINASHPCADQVVSLPVHSRGELLSVAYYLLLAGKGKRGMLLTDQTAHFVGTAARASTQPGQIKLYGVGNANGTQAIGVIITSDDINVAQRSPSRELASISCWNYMGDRAFGDKVTVAQNLPTNTPRWDVRKYKSSQNITMDCEKEMQRSLPAEFKQSKLIKIQVTGSLLQAVRGQVVSTSQLVAEATAIMAALGDGPMAEDAAEEIELLRSLGAQTWQIDANAGKNPSWCSNCAILRVSKDRNNTDSVYLKYRGATVKPVRAGMMLSSQDPEVNDNVPEGVWMDPTERSYDGVPRYTQGGMLNQGGATHGKGQSSKAPTENLLLAYAVAMPEDEYEIMMKHPGSAGMEKYLVHHRDIITEKEKETIKKMDDPRMVNGLLRVISRRVEPGKILVTWGQATVDKRQIAFEQSIVISGHQSTGPNQTTRDLILFDNGRYQTIIVYDESEAADSIKTLRKRQLERNDTITTHNIRHSALDEMAFNQIHDYRGEIDASGSSAAINNFAYMPLTDPMFGKTEGYVTHDHAPEIPTDDIIAFYENKDLTDLVRVQAPLNKGEGKGYKGHNFPMGIIESNKIALTPYPIYSRPVLTRMAYALENAVFNVLASAITYRKHELNAAYEAKMFVKTYGNEEAEENIARWQKNKLYFSTAQVREWLSGRTGIEAIDQELQDILEQGMFNEPLNRANVHVKMEQLLKSDPVTNFAAQQVRIIVWKKKGYAALFSGVFDEAKDRLKEFLGKRFVYADGLTPEQLGNRCRLETCEGFLEDDLTKQDRQTDTDTSACEYQIYRSVLGVHEDVVQLWEMCSDHVYFKGDGIKGNFHKIRETGSKTTAIGNVIVNLLVHRRLVDRLGPNLKLMLVLGDDNLILSDKFINAQELRREIRNYWNMESKAEWDPLSGVFLRMLACRNMDGRVQMGPDFVRLQRKFEFTNGVSEGSDEAVQARVLSYACMLGPLPGVMDAISNCDATVEPVPWYDPVPQFEAVGEKYYPNVPLEHRTAAVLDNISRLTSMMRERHIVEYSWQHFATDSKTRDIGSLPTGDQTAK